MYPEEDYIQLSAIQHYVFCPRQCGLIHIEGQWAENLFTTRGKIMHERVDSAGDESRGDKQIARSLNIYSKRLGLSGRADVVEFNDNGESIVPYPVEYKSGKPKQNISDLAQLCAQALCLEEMLKEPVKKAAVFYGKPRRRFTVEIDDTLRNSTEKVIENVHIMVKSETVPSAKYEKKCDTCSLNDVCQPKTAKRNIFKYVQGVFNTDEETS